MYLDETQSFPNLFTLYLFIIAALLEKFNGIEDAMEVLTEDSRGTKRKAEETITAAQAPKRIKVEDAY